MDAQVAQAQENQAALPVRRKRAHKNRMNPLLPKRPKKAMTSYGLFLRFYFRDHPAQNSAHARTIIREASAAWKNLTAQQRVVFDEIVAPDKDRYENEMAKWNMQKRFLKRPPSIYAMFLKEVWEREKDSGRDVSTMGTYAAGLWKDLSEAEKDVYRRRFETQANEYRQTAEALSTGEAEIKNIGGELPEVKIEMIPPPVSLLEQQNLDIVAPAAAMDDEHNEDVPQDDRGVIKINSPEDLERYSAALAGQTETEAAGADVAANTEPDVDPSYIN